MTKAETKLAVKTISVLNDIVRHIDDREAVMAIVSAMLDQWAADHDMSEEEANAMFADMAAVAPIKHAAVGLPPKLTID